MNIGIVTVWRERGAGVVSEQFARALNENGARVFVFSRGGERGLPSLNCRFVESVRESKPVDNAVTTFFLKSEFLEWINRNSISAVLFNEQHWWPPVLWCREIGVRCGAYVDYYKEDTIPLFGLYDFLVCNTKRHYRAFNWHQGAIYVPWGTDIEAYSAKGAGVSSSNGVRFLHSAGMSPMRKGTDILIRAAKRLRGNYQLLIHTQADNVFSDDNRIRIINSPMSMRDFYPMGDVYVIPQDWMVSALRSLKPLLADSR